MVWDSASKTMGDLNDPAVTSGIPAGWVIDVATSINASGQIVGSVRTTAQSPPTRSCVLTPNP